MNDTFALIATVAMGVALGWWFEGRTRATRKLVIKIIGVVLGVPLLLLLFASVVGSNTLGAIGGFSLMALMALAVPLGLGVLLGKLFGHSRTRDAASEQPAPSRPMSNPPAQPLVQRPAPALSAQRRLVLLIMAGVGSGIWVALAVGFWLHDQPAPNGLNEGLLPAALVLIATLTIVLRAAWQRRAIRLRNEQRDVVAEYNESLAAYESDPDATACCEHLAPFELAMRRAGLRVQSGTRRGWCAMLHRHGSALATVHCARERRVSGMVLARSHGRGSAARLALLHGVPVAGVAGKPRRIRQSFRRK